VKIELDFTGHGIGKLLVPLAVRPQARHEMPENLQKLKQRLESEAHPRPPASSTQKSRKGIPVGTDVYLGVPDRDAPPANVDVLFDGTGTQWGTQVMNLRDPDGRLFRLEAPAER
jgi:hypothetical protein